MLVQISRWGNSLAVRIPAAYAKEIGAAENSKAELSVEHGRLVLRPVPDVPHFELDQLIRKSPMRTVTMKSRPVLPSVTSLRDVRRLLPGGR